jgi:hypothetical protein
MKTRRLSLTSSHASQSGQSMTEYLIVCAALLLALGISLSDPDSMLYQHLMAFKTAYQHFSFSLSIPL